MQAPQIFVVAFSVVGMRIVRHQATITAHTTVIATELGQDTTLTMSGITMPEGDTIGGYTLAEHTSVIVVHDTIPIVAIVTTTIVPIVQVTEPMVTVLAAAIGIGKMSEAAPNGRGLFSLTHTECMLLDEKPRVDKQPNV